MMMKTLKYESYKSVSVLPLGLCPFIIRNTSHHLRGMRERKKEIPETARLETYKKNRKGN